MAITAKAIQELREKTGVGMMDCKRALQESDGDMDEAVKVLRKKGMATAQKKSVRAASEGLVQSCIAAEGKAGALVEVNCETDFVARTDDFIKLVDDMAKQACESAPADEAAFLSQPFSGRPSVSVKDAIVEKVAKLGENIQFRRLVRFEGDLVASYIHAGGKIGVLMQLGCESPADASTPDVSEVVKDLCMQVAASAPRFVSRDDVTQEVLQSEREIYRDQVLAQGKPANIVDKIVEGKMNKYYEENCLLEQTFVKDPSKRVQAYIDEAAGKRLKVVKFARFVLGEGLPSSSCGAE
jgi:elongation factor Ts